MLLSISYTPNSYMHLYTILKTTILVISNIKSNPSQRYQTGAGDRPTHVIPIAWRGKALPFCGLYKFGGFEECRIPQIFLPPSICSKTCNVYQISNKKIVEVTYLKGAIGDSMEPCTPTKTNHHLVTVVSCS